MRILTSKKTCQTAGSINKKVYKDFYEPMHHQQKWEGYLRMICFLLWVVSLVMCILANALFLGHYPLPNRDSIDNCVYYDVNYPFLERRMRSRMMHSDRSEAKSSPNLIWRAFLQNLIMLLTSTIKILTLSCMLCLMSITGISLLCFQQFLNIILIFAAFLPLMHFC